MTGGCHFSNRRYVCGDSFHTLRSPGVTGVEMKIYERSLKALLSLAPRSRVLVRLASLAIGELARRLSLLNSSCSDVIKFPLFSPSLPNCPRPLSSFETHVRWLPVTKSAQSRRSYGKMEDCEQPSLCRIFAYRTRHTQCVGRLFFRVAYVGSLL